MYVLIFCIYMSTCLCFLPRIGSRQQLIERYALEIPQTQSDTTNSSYLVDSSYPDNADSPYKNSKKYDKDTASSPLITSRTMTTPSNSIKSIVIPSNITPTVAPVQGVEMIPIYAFELRTHDELWWLESKVEDDTTLKKTITLLILDPQNDFHEGGPLAVPGIIIVI